MKLVIWHCKRLNYEDVRPSTKPSQLKDIGDLRKGKPKREKKSGKFKDILAVFTCVETGDDSVNVKKAVEAIEAMLKMLNIPRKVIIVPFAHLSPRLALPKYAVERINELEAALIANNIETYKTSFGFHKDFQFRGYGHPGSVAFRDIPSPEPPLKGHFSWEEAMQTGVFICGSPRSGKSNLAFCIADELMKHGVLVYVFDPSQIWVRESGIPSVISVTEETLKAAFIEIPRESTIFDISLLKMSKQVEFVEKLSGHIFTERARSKSYRPSTFLIFEEAQLYIPAGKLSIGAAEELMRIITMGRNYNIRYCLLTQFPSMVDKMAIKSCRQRYFGFCSEMEEQENLRTQIGDSAKELETLETGEFFYYTNGEIRRFRAPRFEK